MSGFAHQPFLWQETLYDPYFSDVLFLSGFEGANESNIITDESSYAGSFTSYDSGTLPNRSYISTASSKFGSTAFETRNSAAAGFSMTADRFARANAQIMVYEFWVYTAVRGAYTETPRVLYIADSFGSPVFRLSAYLTSNDWTFRPNVDFESSFTHSPASGNYTFVQITITAANTVEIRMDGVLKLTRTSISLWTGPATVSVLGVGGGGSAQPCQTFVDEMRITKDHLRSYSIPTSRFPRF